MGGGTTGFHHPFHHRRGRHQENFKNWGLLRARIFEPDGPRRHEALVEAEEESEIEGDRDWYGELEERSKGVEFEGFRVSVEKFSG